MPLPLRPYVTTYAVLPNPVNMTWQDWVDTFVGFNLPVRNHLDPDMPWREFVDRLGLIEAWTPDSDDFENWQDWVVALKAALSM